MNNATPGRILNYVIARGDLPGDRDVGAIRPAMVVRVWSNEYPDGKIWDRVSPADNPNTVPCSTDGYNVQVFLDGQNDGRDFLWLTSLPLCDAPCEGRLFWPTLAPKA